jgi:hypothetical protein
VKDFVRLALGGLGLLGATIAATILGRSPEPVPPQLPAHPRDEQIQRLLPGLAYERDSHAGWRLVGGTLAVLGFTAAFFYTPALFAAIGGMVLARWAGGHVRAARARLAELREERELLWRRRRLGHDVARHLLEGPTRAVAEAALSLYRLAPRVPPSNDTFYRGNVLGEVDRLMERLVAVAQARVACESVLVGRGGGADAATLAEQLARAKQSADDGKALELKARLDSIEDAREARERAQERARALDEAFATFAAQLEGIATQILGLSGPELTQGLARSLSASRATLARMEEAVGVTPDESLLALEDSTVAGLFPEAGG